MDSRNRNLSHCIDRMSIDFFLYDSVTYLCNLVYFFKIKT